MKRRFLIWFLFLTLIYLQYRLWFSQHGLLYFSNLQQDVSIQETSNQTAEECNQYLKQEILYFKNSPLALEEKARYELGMINADEVFVIIDDDLKPDVTLDQCATLQ